MWPSIVSRAVSTSGNFFQFLCVSKDSHLSFWIQCYLGGSRCAIIQGVCKVLARLSAALMCVLLIYARFLSTLDYSLLGQLYSSSGSVQCCLGA